MRENKECVEGKNGKCCLCRDYKSGECPGYFSTITDSNNKNLVSIPLFNEYKDNYFKDLEIKAAEAGLITKQELLNQLKKDGIKIPSRTLTYYMDLGLLPKGILKFIPGLTGSVSFFKDNILLMIAGIKELSETYKLTLKEISKFKNLVYNFNELELAKYFDELEGIADEYIKMAHTLERIKLERIVKIYACAEVGYKYNIVTSGFTINNKIIIAISSPTTIGDYSKKIRIGEIHVKLLELVNGEIVSNDGTWEGLKTFKEIVYSKRGVEIIG